MNKVQKWLYGLLGGCIGGGAGAAVTWLGMAGAKSAGLDVPSLNLKAIGVIFLSGVISNGLLYLKQSPVPPMNGDTSFINKP